MRTKDFIYYASATVLMAVTTQVASADEVATQIPTVAEGSVLRPAGGFLRKADDFQHTCGCFQSSQGTLCFPCAGCASYPFVDLPPGNTLRCKLFPSSKFTIYLFQNRTARSIIKLMTNTI